MLCRPRASLQHTAPCLRFVEPGSKPSKSGSVMHGGDAFLMCAMGATIETAPCFNAVPNDFASAMLAFRCQRLNRAFETIKIVRYTRHNNFQGFIVLVPTNFTSAHNNPSRSIIRPVFFQRWPPGP